jgi:hypothetical protein
VADAVGDLSDCGCASSAIADEDRKQYFSVLTADLIFDVNMVKLLFKKIKKLKKRRIKIN